jgi:hypothetical protein
MDLHYFLSWIRIRVESWNWLRNKIKIQEFQRLKNGAAEGRGTLTIDVWRLKMEAWRVCRPVVADSHHFDE